VEYYEADGTLGVRFPAGFRVAGASSRKYNQKSLNLYLRGGYGLSSVTYPFFEGYDIKTFKSLSLRNMGQDRDFTCLRDAYYHTLANGLNVLNMRSQFAAVYINGKYWGLYEFKENQNEDCLASKYGIDPDKVEFVRSGKNAYVGTEKLVNQLFAIAKASINSEEKWQEYMSLIDVDYFTDYLIFQTYICNSDYYNQKYTHTTDNSLTWRPMLYDLDWGMKGCNSSAIAWGFFSPNGITNTDSKGSVTSFIDTGLFYALYNNEEWRDKFVKRYAELMNTTLSTDNMLGLFDEMAASIRDEMPRQIARWGAPSSVSGWESNVKNLRDCFEARRTYVIKDLQNKFNLSDAEVAELWPNG
jgi:spore coat protein CotH